MVSTDRLIFSLPNSKFTILRLDEPRRTQGTPERKTFRDLKWVFHFVPCILLNFLVFYSVITFYLFYVNFLETSLTHILFHWVAGTSLKHYMVCHIFWCWWFLTLVKLGPEKLTFFVNLSLFPRVICNPSNCLFACRRRPVYVFKLIQITGSVNFCIAYLAGVYFATYRLLRFSFITMILLEDGLSLC